MVSNYGRVKSVDRKTRWSHHGKEGLSEKKGKILSNRHKAVKQISLDGKVVKIWGSIMDAQRDGYDSGCICHVCKGESKTHKGYKWEYA